MTDKNMKNALRMVLQLLINIVILLLLLQVFTWAYNFSYKVFTDNALNPNSTKEVEFVIQPDSSPKTKGFYPVLSFTRFF